VYSAGAIGCDRRITPNPCRVFQESRVPRLFGRSREIRPCSMIEEALSLDDASCFDR
jgi:hypothetical protein